MLFSFKNVMCALSLGIAIMQVGVMQQEDAQTEFRVYCENVENQVWHDYNHVYDLQCKNRP